MTTTIEPQPFYEQDGITATTSNAVLIDGRNFLSVALINTAAGSATAECTFNTREQIEAGTASWVPLGTAVTTNTAYFNVGPLSAVRLNASSGTWNLQVRQNMRF